MYLSKFKQIVFHMYRTHSPNIKLIRIFKKIIKTKQNKTNYTQKKDTLV